MTETSEAFTITPGEYLKVLLSLWIPKYGYLIALPIVLCLVIGLAFDVRFALIAIMLIFIVVPMLSSFLYPYYMLAPEARRSVICKRVEIAEKEYLKLCYLKEEKGEEDINDKRILPEDETIRWEDIKRIRYSPRYRIYVLNTPRLSFILIPHTAFKKSDAIRN